MITSTCVVANDSMSGIIIFLADVGAVTDTQRCNFVDADAKQHTWTGDG